ncbi:hypothetical protein RB195_014843 [Necator americanus]|uniref:Endonuclease/exonuclease/phosphatase domain-containing protein n=1 Tax=Necator americanus TaxID=51031 RepID=A0ABR1E1V7_NECAM
MELGDGYKLIYHGISNRNDIGVILNETFRNSVTAVDRQSANGCKGRCRKSGIASRLFMGKGSCSEEEKACFLEVLEQYIQSQKGKKVLPIGGDFNGHVGSRKKRFGSYNGEYGYGARNDGGCQSWSMLLQVTWSLLIRTIGKENRI